MKRNVSGTDGSFGRSLGDRALWVTDGPDHECDCPGPPPSFHLPPPPRPRSVVDSDCSENSTSRSETCKAVPVIDAEYHYSPVVPPFAVMLIAAIAVAASLLIGIYLVLIKRRKMQQNLFPRKTSSQNRCDPATANSVIYEDLANLHHQMLSPNCPPGQTTLPSMEMIDATSLPERGTFASAFVRPGLPPQDPYDPLELFNPVYEELSNASAEGGETDSEGMPPATMSEDEFAEDELSLAGEPDVRRQGSDDPDDGFPRRYVGGDTCRDVDSSDADDRCKFLENSVTHSSPPADRAGREKSRGSYFRNVSKGPKSLVRRKAWKNTAPASQSATSENRSELHEGFLLKRILQVYPDVTGLGLQYARGLRDVQHSPGNPAGGGHSKSPEAFGGTLELLRHKPEIFSFLGEGHGFGKHQSLDSSLGSDSGYSNNTSGGKSSSKLCPEHPPNNSDNIVPS